MNAALQATICDQLSINDGRFISIGGGSINETFRIEKDKRQWFCKINSAKDFPGLFEKEKNGLAFLHSTNCISVPKVIWCGEENDKQVLLLEWVEQGMKTESFWKIFGEELAALHQWRSDEDLRAKAWQPGRQTAGSSDRDVQTRFGFNEHNYMGALPQLNEWENNWIEFFIQCRLEPQLELATNSKLIGKKEVEQFHSLYKKLESIFSKEPPAALHGDLWSGNYLCGEGGVPVLIDPAVYYGHRCIELGMTRLFGGFDETFYDAYHYHYPLPGNFDEQTDVCNLYPLLIHLNLFGSGYLNSIKSILKTYM